MIKITRYKSKTNSPDFKYFALVVFAVVVTVFLLKTNLEVFGAKPKPVNKGIISGMQVVWNTVPTRDANGNDQPAIVYCPSGKIALGGGGLGDGTMIANTPLGVDTSSGNSGTSLNGATGWEVNFSNPRDPLSSVRTAYAICATVSQ